VVRFLAAGLLLIPFTPQFFRWAGMRTELKWLAAGFTGITGYYLAENAALSLTQATDVGLIVTTIPLLTAVASHLSGGERWTARIGGGALVAALGVVAVMGNGMVLGLDVVGDGLALGAALAFTAYSLVIRGLPSQTPALVTVTRSFLWGTFLALPVLAFDGGIPPVETLFLPQVGWSMLFLVVAASGLAYALWNRAIRLLGPVKTNTYIYVVPVVNTILGAVVLGEPITALTLVGSGLIVGGVVWSSR